MLVAQEAAATVKRVTQELGGKSPNILLPDADFERVVALGVMAAFRNVGQSCSAPTRMLVPHDRLAEVERLAAATAESIVVGDPASEHDRARTDGESRPVQPRARDDRCGDRRRRQARLRRYRTTGGTDQRFLCAADDLLGGAHRDAHRAGGDLRPRALHHALRDGG